MKRFVSLALLLVPHLAFADVSVPRAKQYLWTQYDVSVSGGQSVAHALGAKLPAGAVLTAAWVYINTKFAATGTESLAVQCGGTLNLMAYQAMSSVSPDRMFGGQIAAGTSTGAAALIPSGQIPLNLSQGFDSVPVECEVTAVVRGDSGYTPYTAGSASIILEYFKK